MSANVSERRRDGQRQSPVGFFRRPEGNIRRATALAFPPEGDVDAAEPKPARTCRRRVPSRPDELVLQETNYRDEYCQWVPAVRVARCPRQSFKRLCQGRSAFSQGRCGLFRFVVNAFRQTRGSGGKTFYYSAVIIAPHPAVRPRREGWAVHTLQVGLAKQQSRTWEVGLMKGRTTASNRN